MRLAWACQLPASLLAADPHSARLAVGTPSGSLVLLDAGGQVSGGQGLLHGLSVQAARFYSAAQAAAGEVRAVQARLQVLAWEGSVSHGQRAARVALQPVCSALRCAELLCSAQLKLMPTTVVCRALPPLRSWF